MLSFAEKQPVFVELIYFLLILKGSAKRL